MFQTMTGTTPYELFKINVDPQGVNQDRRALQDAEPQDWLDRNQTWTLGRVGDTAIEIKLNFSTPENISTEALLDKLRIQFTPDEIY